MSGIKLPFGWKVCLCVFVCVCVCAGFVLWVAWAKRVCVGVHGLVVCWYMKAKPTSECMLCKITVMNIAEQSVLCH